MRIAHFGTFDVENYGDLLFPLVLERRLAHLGAEIVHVSPVGGGAVWGDCVATIPTRDLDSLAFDAAIVGGGHIVHAQPSDVPAYRDSPEGGLFAYADLWLGATLRAAALEVPIVWNAPGVPSAPAPETAELLRWAAGEAAYLAVRDPRSRTFLEGAGCVGEIDVVIDTAVEVAGLWSPDALDSAWRAAFVSRGLAIPERAIAFHFNGRFLADGIAATAARLDAIARAGNATPILLALGPCHGDAELARDLSAAMTVDHCLVDAPRSLREIAACIGRSDLYVGSSLHGAITARAFARPAIVVARESEGGHAKFSGFLSAHARLVDSPGDRPSALVASWEEAWELVARSESAADPDPGSRRVADDGRLRAELDRHWRRLGDAVQGRDGAGAPVRRARRAGYEAIAAARWRRAAAYVGVLLDQAGEAAKLRESAQKNARRFRELDRRHRDLKRELEVARAAMNPGESKRDDREGS